MVRAAIHGVDAHGAGAAYGWGRLGQMQGKGARFPYQSAGSHAFGKVFASFIDPLFRRPVRSARREAHGNREPFLEGDSTSHHVQETNTCACPRRGFS